ncbi:hypothetical protein SAMN05421776_11314 [Nocardia farcinica]|uniref:Uncharacterized protein n=1 Tax=Nocardia farcinica TaxID=37329 RepID=A0A0H5PA85_NOCFR|nr:hypothetical protein CJ469_05280 [Nocardia farcinica]PFX06771.1 hypothetical protein CJ468_04171 [Nocardia farcinica]CRY84612.1 Uncharacterised protein [Nocardia farcinica]SIT32460.1 hypothetical protein SAMN05421776_11314 [Nocardia farcinica]
MTGRTPRADFLFTLAAVGLPWLAVLLVMTTKHGLRPDPVGLALAVAALAASVAVGYAALRWHGRSAELSRPQPGPR